MSLFLNFVSYFSYGSIFALSNHVMPVQWTLIGIEEQNGYIYTLQLLRIQGVRHSPKSYIIKLSIYLIQGQNKTLIIQFPIS